MANPIKKFGYQGKGRAAMRLLKEEILQKVLLRRTKVQCADVLALPPRCIRVTNAHNQCQALGAMDQRRSCIAQFLLLRCILSFIVRLWRAESTRCYICCQILILQIVNLVSFCSLACCFITNEWPQDGRAAQGPF